MPNEVLFWVDSRLVGQVPGGERGKLIIESFYFGNLCSLSHCSIVITPALHYSSFLCSADPSLCAMPSCSWGQGRLECLHPSEDCAQDALMQNCPLGTVQRICASLGLLYFQAKYPHKIPFRNQFHCVYL